MLLVIRGAGACIVVACWKQFAGIVLMLVLLVLPAAAGILAPTLPEGGAPRRQGWTT